MTRPTSPTVRRPAIRALLVALATGTAAAVGCTNDHVGAGGARETRVASALGLPADYHAQYTHYADVYCLQMGRMRALWANDAAVRAARAGGPLPAGTVLVAEMYALESSPDGEPTPGTLYKISVSRRLHAVGSNTTLSDWSFSGRMADLTPIAPGGCAGCHENAELRGYVYTGEDLAWVARHSGPARPEPLRHPSLEGTTECR